MITYFELMYTEECDAGLLLLESVIFMLIGELKAPQSTKEELVKDWDGKRGSLNPARDLTLTGVIADNNKTTSITISHETVSQIVQSSIQNEIDGMFNKDLSEALKLFNPSVIISGGGSRVKCIVDSLKCHLKGRKIEVAKEQYECIRGAIYLWETSTNFYHFLETVDFCIAKDGKKGAVQRFPYDKQLKWGRVSVKEGDWNIFWKHHFKIDLHIFEDGYISLGVLPGAEDSGKLSVVQNGTPIVEVDIVYDRFSRNIFTKM